MPILGPFLQWLLKNVLLDWVLEKVKALISMYKRRAEIKKDVHEDIQTLKDAKTAEEVEDAAAKLADDF